MWIAAGRSRMVEKPDPVEKRGLFLLLLLDAGLLACLLAAMNE
jgi:hypothetical protein